MANNSLDDVNCAVAQSLSVIGEWWSLMILRDAFHGVKTFEGFQGDLGISTSVLSRRLQTLTNAGIFERKKSAVDKRSWEYHLSELGLELYPILIGLLQWGEKYAPGEGGERLRLLEKSTGKPIRGAVVLSADGQALGPRDVRFEPGPGADQSLSELIANRAKRLA